MIGTSGDVMIRSVDRWLEGVCIFHGACYAVVFRCFLVVGVEEVFPPVSHPRLQRLRRLPWCFLPALLAWVPSLPAFLPGGVANACGTVRAVMKGTGNIRLLCIPSILRPQHGGNGISI